MHINILNKSEIEYTLTSDINDDSYDFEVSFKNNCIMAFHISNEGEIYMMMGEIRNYWIDVILLEEIISDAKSRLKQEQDAWLKSKRENKDLYE